MLSSVAFLRAPTSPSRCPPPPRLRCLSAAEECGRLQGRTKKRVRDTDTEQDLRAWGCCTVRGCYRAKSARSPSVHRSRPARWKGGQVLITFRLFHDYWWGPTHPR